LCSISYGNKRKDGVMLLYGGLNEEALLLIKQIIKACIQKGNMLLVHKIRKDLFKFKS
jgi:hypothetical protein